MPLYARVEDGEIVSTVEWSGYEPVKPDGDLISYEDIPSGLGPGDEYEDVPHIEEEEDDGSNFGDNN